MAADFTVVFAVRQHFGNQVQDVVLGLPEVLGEGSAPFVGREKDYTFSCPGVDSGEYGVLVFQALGVSWRHEIYVNGSLVYGGNSTSAVASALGSIDVAESSSEDYINIPVPVWNTQSLIISKNTLRESNTLSIKNRPREDGGVDDFILDNCLVHFKTN